MRSDGVRTDAVPGSQQTHLGLVFSGLSGSSDSDSRAEPDRFQSGCVLMCGSVRVLFGAEQLQLVLVLCEKSLKAQVFSDDGEDFTQQLPFVQTQSCWLPG